jgi:L-lactate dehydrogenase (cytochrome)
VLRTLRSVLRFREFERDPDRRRLRHAANVDDLRRIARRRLPRGVFDYVDGAAEDEHTLRRNRDAFAAIEFVPRVLRDVSAVTTASTLLGRPSAMPLALSPTGFTRMVAPDGELAVARAAARAGIPYTLSTLSTQSIEAVGAASTGRKWFQVYVWRDRGLVRSMLERARDAGFEAIMITVDTAVLGRRERDVRRGFTMPPKVGVETLVDGVLHPGWTWAFARSDPIVFSNVVGSTDVGDGSDPVSLADFINSQFDPSLSWNDIEWFRAEWDGPILIKGIQSVADARLAADAGVDAIVLSNHGGRQLDGSPPPIELVGPVADAVAGRAEVICDGGVRRGSDIVKAMALGATACTMGRPYLYALGAGGEQGVDWVLSFFRSGLRRTLALTGYADVADLDREAIRPAAIP